MKIRITQHRALAWLSSFGGAIAIFCFAVLPASAANSVNGSGSGLKISPVITNLTISPGQTQTVAVYVQNVTSAPLNIQTIINDFVANPDESGAPALLLDSQYAPSHSLKRFVAPLGSFTLQPGEQKTVNAVITIPSGTPGGGYFGAVRFLPSTASGGNTVTLTASVGSLILVKVPGNYKEALQLVSLSAEKSGGGSSVLFTSNKDILGAVRFQNTGDIQEQPFGKLLLESGSTILGSYEINSGTPRGNVLPSSIRKFSVALDKVGSFGHYTLIGNFGYGANGQLLSGKTSFYVVPLPIIGLVIVLIIIVIALVVGGPGLVHRHDRKLLRRVRR